ncbi:UDP-glucuronosyltransferase 1A9-like [Tubulanus polymorphus]|uniref:UDP-glucuronosyltransferase 1A9-like n=1 Tax=Tubulanus polymorphus TaxID=672921 RepID=UPI003DA621D9
MRVLTSIASILALLSFPVASGKRALLIPTMWASHILEMSQLGRELVHRGHEVHMLMSETVKKMPNSLTNSGIKFLRYSVDYDADPFTDELLFNLTLRNWKSGGGVAQEMEVDRIMGQRECRSLLKNEDVFNRIVSMRFDIAVVDGFGPSLCRYIIPYQAGIPYGSLTAVIWPYMSTLATLPSVTVGLYSSSTDRMGFSERISNLISHYKFWSLSESNYNLEEFMGSFVPDKPYNSLTDLARQSQFWIIETEGLMDYNRISLPHIHYVGGLTTDPPKALRGEILEICDKAIGGIILVSFGSRVTHLPYHYILRFMEGLNKVNKKYTVVFKYGGSTKDIAISENIHIVNWMPQNDILGHSNTRLFVTHCGNNGRYEALYHGIPMLAFPFDADQPVNALGLGRKGYGRNMDMKTFKSDELAENIHEIIENPRYKNAIQKASDIFRDLPNPREKAASVVEQVMKHGADHWYMPASELHLYEIIMLDITLTLVFLVFCCIIVLKCCIIMLCIRYNSNKNNKEKRN